MATADGDDTDEPKSISIAAERPVYNCLCMRSAINVSDRLTNCQRQRLSHRYMNRRAPGREIEIWGLSKGNLFALR